jgi:hypothetical protein
MPWRTRGSSHRSSRSSGRGCAAPTCSAPTACAWCRSGHRNAYHFNDPSGASPKGRLEPETQSFFFLGAASGGERTARFGRKEAFEGEIARTLPASGTEKQNIGRQ